MRARRPFILGLVGGIGAGKSEVARVFAELGCVVSDSDGLAREALQREDVRRTLVEWWGPDVLDDAGRIDRRAVGAIVFRDREQRTRLEGLTHPVIKAARAAQIAGATRDGVPVVVVDAPLLFEAGVDAECDAVAFVDAPEAVRRERVSARGWDPGELARREGAQMSLELKRAKSEYVIENAGSRSELRNRVESLLREILGTCAGHPGSGPA